MTKLKLTIAAVLAVTTLAVGAAAAQGARRDKAAAAPPPVALPAACLEAAPQGFRSSEACKAKGSNPRFTWQVAADSGCACEVTAEKLSCKTNGAGSITLQAEGTWKTYYAPRAHGMAIEATGAGDIRCTPVANADPVAATPAAQ